MTAHFRVPLIPGVVEVHERLREPDREVLELSGGHRTPPPHDVPGGCVDGTGDGASGAVGAAVTFLRPVARR